MSKSQLGTALRKTNQVRMVLMGLAIILMLASLYLALEWAPEASGFSAPKAQRIMYIHIPCAWVSFLAFGILMAASIIYLRTGDDAADALASASGEVGVVLCTLALITGSIWAKEEWGTYWRSDDPKLITTFVLWLLYLGYMVMRPSTNERPTDRDARQAAVLGIMAFVCVPLTFMSSRIWSSLHPNVVATSKGSLSGEMAAVLAFCVVAMTILFLHILLLRVELVLNWRDFTGTTEDARHIRAGGRTAGRTGPRTMKKASKGGTSDGR